MAVAVMVIEVAVSFGKTPAVSIIMVGKVTVTAPELSSAAAFGKITATHMRSITHAMWSIPAHGMRSTTAAHSMGSSAGHRVRSTTAHAMRSTTTGSQASATSASATEVCATASSASAPSAAPTASVTVTYEG
jgi:hypothetical protein